MIKQKSKAIAIFGAVLFLLIAAIALCLSACNPDVQQNDPPAHVHSLTAVAKKDATCTEKGNEAYWKCESCGKMFSDKDGNKEIYSVPEIAAKGHNVSDYKVTKEADCTEKGEKFGKCDVCGLTVTEQIPATGHDMQWSAEGETHVKKCTRCGVTEGEAEQHVYNDDGQCVDCGAQRSSKPYVLSEDGTTLTFGSYPQSKVEDPALQSMLNATIQNKTPTADEFNGWTDYEYYWAGSIKSFMWYIDVNYKNAKYRGVYFDEYRPDRASDEGDRDWSIQPENGYDINIVYWFKWEPITWRILSNDGGKALIMSDMILDSQQYYHSNDEDRFIEVEPYFIQPNNYKESEIRAWLNDNFYNTAFDNLCKEYVVCSEVDNSAETTAKSTNQYVCENTNDNVFLLSYKDVKDVSYGFDSGSGACEARMRKNSDYALCQGALQEDGYGIWWLRSPYDYSRMCAHIVYSDGMVGSYNLYYLDVGVVPALWLTL